MEAHQRGTAPPYRGSGHGSSPGRCKMRASRGGARRGQHGGDTVFSAQEPPPPPLSTLGSCHPAAVRARPPPSVLSRLRRRPRLAAPVFHARPPPQPILTSSSANCGVSPSPSLPALHLRPHLAAPTRVYSLYSHRFL